MTLAFNKYYYSNNENVKNKTKERFRNVVWGSLPYEKLTKFFKYKISYHNIENSDAIELLKKNKYIEYKVLKSRYNLQNIDKVDLVKARINSNYGKYFDHEVYLKKEYYRALAEYKNIYFNYLSGDIKDLGKEIEQNDLRVSNLKKESLNLKFSMNWDDYKSFIDMCFDQIFENYIPIDVKIKEGTFIPNGILDWDEDNYILVYINKSLNGYLKNYINELKGNRKKIKYDNCTCCGKTYKKKSNRQKYCSDCWKEIRDRQNREKALKYYHKTKNFTT